MTDAERVAFIRRAMAFADEGVMADAFEAGLVDAIHADLCWLCDQLEAAWAEVARLKAYLEVTP